MQNMARRSKSTWNAFAAMVQLYCHFMETRRKAPCGQAASVGVPVGCV